MAERKAFPLRVDPALWAAVERLAACDLRSANAEVEFLLREALRARGVKLGDPKPVRRGRPSKETNDE
ncbi:MAG: toxin-antitoxin system HicB family antitoxin [Sphingomicrobium sp.]